VIRWLFYLPCSLLASVVCYLTNWIVVFFSNEEGELPGVFHLWQTWDNSLDCSDSVECAPSIFKYDWAAHYREYKDTTQYLRSVNRERWFVECINNDFTIWEVIKRYFCRTLWLMRNNAYGWGFYVLGYTSSPLLLVNQSENTIYVDEVNGDGWMYKNTAPIFTAFGWTVHWNNLLGWKLDTDAKFDTRSMIANRVTFFFEREAE